MLFFLWHNSLFLLNTGQIICDYTNALTANIINRGSAYLDVALLPEIFITSDPQFPDCRKSATINTKIMCVVYNSTEPYEVTWVTTGLSINTETSKLHRYFLSDRVLFLHMKHLNMFTYSSI